MINLDVGIVTEAKNEEGLTVKVQVGILVHTVKKKPADKDGHSDTEKNVSSC